MWSAGQRGFDLVKWGFLAQIPPMNITQILLGSTGAMLLAALILSWGAMKGEELEDGRRVSAKDLMQENARLQAEIDRLRTGQPIAGAVSKVDVPDAMSKTKLREIEERNAALAVQLAEEKKKRELAEEEASALTQREAGKLNKEQRRAKMIGMAMLQAQVKEIGMREGKIEIVVIDVMRPQSVRVKTELAIRRGTGIIGRLEVSNIDLEGNVIAVPLPGTFPGGKMEINVGDELIIPPQ